MPVTPILAGSAYVTVSDPAFGTSALLMGGVIRRERPAAKS